MHFSSKLMRAVTAVIITASLTYCGVKVESSDTPAPNSADQNAVQDLTVGQEGKASGTTATGQNLYADSTNKFTLRREFALKVPADGYLSIGQSALMTIDCEGDKSTDFMLNAADGKALVSTVTADGYTKVTSSAFPGKLAAGTYKLFAVVTTAKACEIGLSFKVVPSKGNGSDGDGSGKNPEPMPNPVPTPETPEPADPFLPAGGIASKDASTSRYLYCRSTSGIVSYFDFSRRVLPQDWSITDFGMLNSSDGTFAMYRSIGSARSVSSGYYFYSIYISNSQFVSIETKDHLTAKVAFELAGGGTVKQDCKFSTNHLFAGKNGWTPK